jgi:hypothetical protein
MWFANLAAGVFKRDKGVGLVGFGRLAMGSIWGFLREGELCTQWWRIPGWPRARDTCLICIVRCELREGGGSIICVRSDKVASDKTVQVTSDIGQGGLYWHYDLESLEPMLSGVAHIVTSFLDLFILVSCFLESY